MKNIILYGDLGKRFGRYWRLDVRTPHEALRGIIANCPAVEGYLAERMESGVEYRVYLNDEQVTDPARLTAPISSRETIHIVPIIGGADGGPFQVLVGVVLLFVPGGQPLGIALIAGGVIGMLTKPPNKHDSDQSTEPSFFFNGAENTTVQGGCVAVCYGGPLIIGSDVISSGMFAEDF